MGFIRDFFERAVMTVEAASGRLREINTAHAQSFLLADIEREPKLDREQKRLLQLSALGRCGDVRDYLEGQPEAKKTALQKLLMDSLLEVPGIHKNPRAVVETLRDTGFSFHNYMYRHVKKEDEYKFWALPLAHANNAGVEAAAMLAAERARERISTNGTYTPDFGGMYNGFIRSGREKYEDPAYFKSAFVAVQNELVGQVAAAAKKPDDGSGAAFLARAVDAGRVASEQARLWTRPAKEWATLPATAREPQGFAANALHRIGL